MSAVAGYAFRAYLRQIGRRWTPPPRTLPPRKRSDDSGVDAARYRAFLDDERRFRGARQRHDRRVRLVLALTYGLAVLVAMALLFVP